MPDDAVNHLQALLNKLGIKRIVCVDDAYDARFDLAALIAWAGQANNANAVNGFFNSIGMSVNLNFHDGTVNAALRTLFQDPLTASRFQAFVDGKQAQGTQEESDSRLFTDRRVLNTVDQVFLDVAGFQPLNPSDWDTQKKQIISSISTTPTLFIFDENLGDGVVSGTTHIQTIASTEQGGSAFYVLLSFEITKNAEHDKTRELQSKNIVATAISKHEFSEKKGLGLLCKKLSGAVLWKEANDLRKLCESSISSASIKAIEHINALTPTEFDELVFGSSNREGVHELDTLIRLYANQFATQLRESTRTNEETVKLIHFLRQYSYQESLLELSSIGWQIQHDEYYESGEYINLSHMPTTPGDIYEIEIEINSQRSSNEFVLIAPICDLVVRSNGQRKCLAGFLCKILDEKPKPEQAQAFFNLAYYDYDHKERWVSFGSATLVDLWLLDLCVLSTDGRAICSVNQNNPELTEGWQKYCDEVLKEKVSTLVRLSNTFSNVSSNVRTKYGLKDTSEIPFGVSGAIKAQRIESDGKVSHFPVRRKARLSEMLQLELVRAFGDSFGRAARPHTVAGT